MKNLLPIVLLAASLQASAQTACLHYGGEVTLAGVVELHEFYGPPGYGENPASDARERQALLKLDTPICVEPGSDDQDEAERNQARVTLVPPASNVALSGYQGRHVTVKGKLFHAISGHHHTPVLIQLQQEPDTGPPRQPVGTIHRPA
jgi:hypothetical protein